MSSFTDQKFLGYDVHYAWCDRALDWTRRITDSACPRWLAAAINGSSVSSPDPHHAIDGSSVSSPAPLHDVAVPSPTPESIPRVTRPQEGGHRSSQLHGHERRGKKRDRSHRRAQNNKRSDRETGPKHVLEHTLDEADNWGDDYYDDYDDYYNYVYDYYDDYDDYDFSFMDPYSLNYIPGYRSQYF